MKYFTVYGYISNGKLITNEEEFILPIGVSDYFPKTYYTICKSIGCYRIIKKFQNE